ncbi:MAG: hypothetical protein WCC87_11750 [Candidatus Korobacteraceae bacterium]
MTIETRSSIELGDIVAFEMECSKCHARTIRKIVPQFDVPPKCGNCGAGWMMHGSAELNSLREFLTQLQSYIKTPPNQNFVMRLEVSGLKDERSK